MTNKDYVINKLQEMITNLENIKTKVSSNGIPNNEDWSKCAIPLNDIMNIMGNYAICKDNEHGTDIFSQL